MPEMISRACKQLFLITSILILFLSAGLQAGIRVSPGFKLGGGISSIFGQDTYQQEWQPSLQVGLSVELTLKGPLAAAVELNFVRRGSVYRLEADGLDYRERYLFDYLEVPFLAKFYFASARKMTFYVYAGPSVALNLKARLRVTLDDLEETVEVDNLQGTDLLLTGGAGTTISLKPGSLILEARYCHGLKSVATEPEADLRNKGLVFLAGFRF